MSTAVKHLFALLSIVLLVDSGGVFGNAYAMAEEQVTFYTTYGYRQGDAWVVPMRVWVHERRGAAEKVITRVASSMGNLEPQEIANFRARIQDFVADSESREQVAFAFDHDPEQQDFQVENPDGTFPKTDLNGLVQGLIAIPDTKARELLTRQGSQYGWLTFRATSKGHTGTGRVRLIEPTGLSVVSDIDDTIKLTDIPAGAKVVIRNTFFRDFVPVPEMAGMYQAWLGAAFHYISGSPWQLYEPLSNFLFSPTGGFPEGSVHMKNARKNLLNPDTWQDLSELITNENLTYEQKLAQISEIMSRFPERRFILIGDSGEKDPEVYREIKQRFPAQVQEIMIRDCIHEREKNPARLEGMTVIPASIAEVPGAGLEEKQAP
jgi:hypothetical protein